MPAPSVLPNGRIDRIKAGSRNITIQTEFFPEPAWRLEIKVYVDGALKKLDTIDLADRPESELQGIVDSSHEAAAEGLAARLRAQSEARSGDS